MFKLLHSALYGSGTRITVPPLQPLDIEHSSDRRARRLKHLLKANHALNALVAVGEDGTPDRRNALGQALCSAFCLDASPDELTGIYEAYLPLAQKWKPAPGEVTVDDWTDYLGQPRYQRAFVDFFEDRLVEFGYNWKHLLHHFLHDGSDPLLRRLITHDISPLIHLSYAYLFSSPTLAIEALALAACSSSPLLCSQNLSKVAPSPVCKKESLAKQLEYLQTNPKLKNQSFDSIEDLITKRFLPLAEYCAAWDLSNPDALPSARRMALAMLDAKISLNERVANTYNALMGVGGGKALEVVLRFVDSRAQEELARRWWLFVLAFYVLDGMANLQRIPEEQDPNSMWGWEALKTNVVARGFKENDHVWIGVAALVDQGVGGLSTANRLVQKLAPAPSA